MKGLGKSKVFNLAGSDDLLIDAYAPVAGGGDFRRIRFKAAQIDYTYEIDKDISGIALENGVAIPVALGFDALNKKIYAPDVMAGEALDLTKATGEAVGEVKALRLSKEFNPAAKDNVEKDAAMEIIFYAHGEKSDRRFRRLKLTDQDIDFFEPHASRQNTETFVALRNAVDGWSSFYVPLPITNFTYYLNEAKRSGQKVLDLSEHTRPKKTTDLKMD